MLYERILELEDDEILKRVSFRRIVRLYRNFWWRYLVLYHHVPFGSPHTQIGVVSKLKNPDGTWGHSLSPDECWQCRREAAVDLIRTYCLKHVSRPTEQDCDDCGSYYAHTQPGKLPGCDGDRERCTQFKQPAQPDDPKPRFEIGDLVDTKYYRGCQVLNRWLVRRGPHMRSRSTPNVFWRYQIKETGVRGRITAWAEFRLKEHKKDQGEWRCLSCDHEKPFLNQQGKCPDCVEKECLPF